MSNYKHSDKDKYLFFWCRVCDCLKMCYYQHGELSNEPYALCADCYRGPYKEEKGENNE